jgi:hypothetical protein
MSIEEETMPSRRKAFALICAALVGSAAILATTGDAEARGGRGGRGRPYGWGRGRKRGWSKRGGPKWRW